MHKQPCYKDAPAYVNGVSEALFKVGMCLPAGPYVSDDDVMKQEPVPVVLPGSKYVIG